MPSHDIFALDPSGFNGFLFATIGTEVGGSALTVLSALARLGEDPWAKAAGWAKLSKAAAGEALAACIAQMPLAADDLRAAPVTAARLVTLLSPPKTAAVQRDDRSPSPARPQLKMALVIIACIAFAFGGNLLASRSVPVSQHIPADSMPSHER